MSSQEILAISRPVATLETAVGDDLGEYIRRDTVLLEEKGWNKIVIDCRGKGDFSELKFEHPPRDLLRRCKARGVPVKSHTKPWSKGMLDRAIKWGAHKSCHKYVEFLEEEFKDMINKGQWIILPYSKVKELPGLRLSPPGVVPQRDRRPCWIVDYFWWNVNQETLSLAPKGAMQFGHALDRILGEILLADPAYGPPEMMKVDIADSFYRIQLNVDNIPQLGVVFPTKERKEPLVAFPLVLPMGWVNSPPAFCAATETSAALANARIQEKGNPPQYTFDALASEQDDESEREPSLDIPKISRDPCLPQGQRRKLLQYVGVFVDNFLGLAQWRFGKQRV